MSCVENFQLSKNFCLENCATHTHLFNMFFEYDWNVQHNILGNLCKSLALHIIFTFRSFIPEYLHIFLENYGIYTRQQHSIRNSHFQKKTKRRIKWFNIHPDGKWYSNNIVAKSAKYLVALKSHVPINLFCVHCRARIWSGKLMKLFQHGCKFRCTCQNLTYYSTYTYT